MIWRNFSCQIAEPSFDSLPYLSPEDAKIPADILYSSGWNLRDVARTAAETVKKTHGMAYPTHILVADRDGLLSELICDFLAKHGMIGTRAAPSELTGTGLAGKDDFQAVLLDGTVFDLPGHPCIKELVDAIAPRPVLLLASETRRDALHRAIEGGVRGVISKASPLKTFLNALRFVLAGEVFIPASFLASGDAGADRGDVSTLNARELEVLRLVCQGRMNKEIGEDLGLSIVTVKMHVRSICAKLSARNRTQAALIGSRLLSTLG